MVPPHVTLSELGASSSAEIPLIERVACHWVNKGHEGHDGDRHEHGDENVVQGHGLKNGDDRGFQSFALHEIPDINCSSQLIVDGQAAKCIDPEIDKTARGQHIHKQEFPDGASLAETGEIEADGRAISEEKGHVDDKPGICPVIV